MSWVGIDYGSKLAGTTVICCESDGKLRLERSIKSNDADQMILHFVKNNPVEKVFLDAPLSLPSAIHGEGDNYFFRKCDKELGAMSPMFLGGLTARAIALKDELAASNIHVYETYPKALVNNDSNLLAAYKKNSKDLTTITIVLNKVIPFELLDTPISYHDIDAILCWWSGYRFQHNQHITIGDSHEGCIIF